MIMKHFERRFLALVMSIMMLFFTMIPTDTLAATLRTSSEPVMTTKAGDDSDPFLETFEETKDDYVSAVVSVYNGSGTQTPNIAVGQVFSYVVNIDMKQAGSYENKNGTLRPLFSTYDDVSAKVKAPAGVVLCDASGNELSLDADGYYTILTNPSINATKEDYHSGDIRVYAKMTGNGTVANGTVYDALDVKISADTTITQYDPDSTVTDDRSGSFVASVSGTTQAVGVSSGAWTLTKTAVATKDIVRTEGGQVKITYTIRVGKPSTKGDDVATDTASYDCYGTVDLSSLTITDTIPAVTGYNDKTGILPNSVVVSGGNAPTGVTVSADNATITIDQTALTKVSTDKVASGEVYNYGQFTVECYYDAADFTYKLTDEDPTNFDFTNSATLDATMKDNSTSNVTKDAETGWYAVAGGGNLTIDQWLFLKSDATQANIYNTTYSKTMGLGDVTYKVYLADKVTENADGSITTSGDPLLSFDVWDGQGGVVQTKDLIKSGDTKWNDKIPVGDVYVVVDYSATDDRTIAVNASNTTPATQWVKLAITEGGDTTGNFYLRYVNGGFVELRKQFVDANGNTSVATGVTFTFTDKSTGTVYTFTTDNEGKIDQALPEGTYTVKETATQSGYILDATEYTVTIPEGAYGYVNGQEGTSAKAIVNYKNEGKVTLGSYKTDAWSDVDTTKSTQTATTGKKYVIYQNGEPYEGGKEYGETTVLLPLQDADGDPYTYTVVAQDETTYGSIKDGETAHDGAQSQEFTLTTDNSSATLDFYYPRTVTITVSKVLADKSGTLSKAGWEMVLSKGTEEIAKATTDANGTATFDGLALTDASGYITYTVTETYNGEVYPYTVSYKVDQTTSDDKASVTIVNGQSDYAVTVTNTTKSAKIRIRKYDVDDNDNNKKELKDKNAKFIVYYVDADDVKHYYVDEKTYSTDSAEAKQFNDSSSYYAMLLADDAVTYYAQEIVAPDGYLLDDTPVSFVPSKTDDTYIRLYDVKKPVIQVEKLLKTYNANGQIIDETAKASGSATFGLYTKDDAGNYVAVTDADGNAITFTLTVANEYTSWLTLEEPGDYYIKETSTCAQWVYKADYNTTADADGYIPVTNVSTVNQAKYQGAVTNFLNQGVVTVTKLDAKTNEKVVTTTAAGEYDAGKEMTFDLLAEVDTSDTVTIAALEARGFKAFSGSYDLPSGVLPSDKTYYVLSGLTTKSSELYIDQLPIEDGNGDPLTYYAVETDAPNGYWKRLYVSNGKMVDGNNGTLGTMSNGRTALTISDEPKAYVQVDKYVQDVWDIVTNNQNANRVSLNGVTMTLYHVNASGVIDAKVDTGKTGKVTYSDGSTGEGVYFSGSVAGALGHYVVVETSSTSTETGETYDTWYDTASHASGLQIPEITLGVTTLDEVKQTKGNIVYEIDGFNRISVNGNYYAITSMDNYVPFVQLTFMKKTQTWTYNKEITESGVVPEGTEGKWIDGSFYVFSAVTDGLDHAKFNLYTVTKSAYDAAGLSTWTAADVKKYGTTDGYVYETGTFSSGTFVTNDLDFSHENVYFFIETEAPAGYTMSASYVDDIDEPTTVVGPMTYEEYESSKNHTYEDPDGLTNVIIVGPGDGETLYRYMQFKLEKTFDKDEDDKFTTGSDGVHGDENHPPLAKVTFSVTLTKLDGSALTVDGEPLMTTQFTTGVNKDLAPDEDEGYGISESLYLSRLLYNYIDDENSLGGSKPDEIFEFTYTDKDGNTHEATFADFVAAAGTSDANEDLTDNTTWRRSRFDLTARYELVEESYPDNATPWHKSYVLKVSTAGTMYTVNDDYYYEGSHGPVLNLYGRFVYVRVSKYVDDNSTLWTPDDSIEWDHVTFNFVDNDHKGKEADGWTQTDVSVKIDASNYKADQLPLVLLNPDSNYTLTETWVPKGYDKPVTNKVDFKTRSINTRTSSDDSERIQDVSMTDQPYVTVKIRKVDSNGDPVNGAVLQLYYRNDVSGFSSTEILDANGKALDATVYTKTVGVDGTDEEKAAGIVTFTVPRYDYRVDETDGGASTTAKYGLMECGNGYSDFVLYNTKNTMTLAAPNAAQMDGQTYDVINPETTDVTLTKLGKDDDTAALADVTFDLYYIAPTADELYATKVTSKSVSAFTDATLVGSYTTDANGQIKFEGLKSGFYRLVENTVPEGYMFEGKVIRKQFVLITPGDAVLLTRVNEDLAKKAWWYNGGSYKSFGSTETTVGIADSATGNEDTALNTLNNNKGYNTCTFTDGSIAAGTMPAIEVTNTAKGHLQITKTVKESDLITVPETVTYIVVPAGTTSNVTQVTVTMDGNTGASDVISLEPGEYDVYEVLPDSNKDGYVAIETVTNEYPQVNADASEDNTAADRDPVVDITPVESTYKVATVKVARANTAESPVVVSYTNVTSKLQAKIHKVTSEVGEDGSYKPVQSATFVMYYKDADGAAHYYKGVDEETGLGVYTTSLSEAQTFTVDADDNGYLTIEYMAADPATATADDWKQTYYLKETAAVPAYLQMIEDHEMQDMVVGELTDESDEDLIDYAGVAIDIWKYGRKANKCDEDTNYSPLVPGAQFELYLV